MATEIRISPEQIRSRANEYRVESDNVEQVTNRLDQLLNQIQTEWEGNASQAYAARYQELRPGFEKVRELINEFAQGLDQAANTLEEADNQIAASFRA